MILFQRVYQQTIKLVIFMLKEQKGFSFGKLLTSCFVHNIILLIPYHQIS